MWQCSPGLAPKVATACSAWDCEYRFHASSVFWFALRRRARDTWSWPVMDCPSKMKKGVMRFLLQ